MRAWPNENQMPFLYRDIFEMIRKKRPTTSRAKGNIFIIDGFRKRLGPIKAASNPSTTIIDNGS